MKHFYGWETASPFVRQLYDDLLACWCAETCAPRMRPDWSPENPTLGQCSITSFLVQDLMGGKVYGVPLPEGGYHCFNAAQGMVFDLASEQFGDRVLTYTDEYEQLREDHLSDPDKKARYELLKTRLEAVRAKR